VTTLFRLLGNTNTIDLQISSITAIYNPVLTTNFVGTLLIMNQRKQTNPEIFTQPILAADPQEAEDHKWVQDQYIRLTQNYPWNVSTTTTPIIPAFHGTDMTVAEKICETGFAALSRLDAGWFGRGIYFSSYPQYCIPYITDRQQPAVLVSYILPGNVYPVIEKHSGPHSIEGTAIKSGFNSHYVVTNKTGEAITQPDTETFNEIVVPQEAQIVPAFLVGIAKKGLKKVRSQWLASTTERV